MAICALRASAGKRCVAEERDLAEIELLEPFIVASLRVGVGHRGKILAVVGRVFQQSGKQVARLLELFRVGFLTCSFVRELFTEVRIRVLRGLQQHGDGLRLHFHTPVEIDSGAHDSENLWIVVVERLDVLLRCGEILTALVEAGLVDTEVAGA